MNRDFFLLCWWSRLAVIWHRLVARDRIPISWLGLILMRILVFDGRSPVKPLPVSALWESSRIFHLINLAKHSLPKELDQISVDYLAPLLGPGFPRNPKILQFFSEAYTLMKCRETVLTMSVCRVVECSNYGKKFYPNDLRILILVRY